MMIVDKKMRALNSVNFSGDHSEINFVSRQDQTSEKNKPNQPTLFIAYFSKSLARKFGLRFFNYLASLFSLVTTATGKKLQHFVLKSGY